MTENRPDARPPGYCLLVGSQMFPLDRGTTVLTDAVPGLGPPGQVVCRVNQNPQQADLLGLQNLSNRRWSVRLPDGKVVSVEPQATVRLAEGIQVDFGGVTASVGTRKQAVAPLPIERAVMERLAGVLQASCEQNRLSQEQYSRLHAAFFAHDSKGKIWTFGLRSRSWHKIDAGQWVPGNPPRQLFIAAGILDQLLKLEVPAP